MTFVPGLRLVSAAATPRLSSSRSPTSRSNDVGLRLVHERGIRHAGGDDLQVGQPTEHRRERLAHEAIVVDDRNRDQLLGGWAPPFGPIERNRRVSSDCGRQRLNLLPARGRPSPVRVRGSRGFYSIRAIAGRPTQILACVL